MMYTSNESQLLQIVEAVRQLTPEQRIRLQRRLRASGLLMPEEYVTDRNRLRLAPALVLATRDQGPVQDAVTADEPTADSEQDGRAEIAAPGEDEGDYRSPVSGRVVVGSLADANVDDVSEMSPLPGQAPQQTIEIIFDGGSRGNPGQGYGSYAMLWPGSPQQIVRLSFGDKVTNNEAEYDTLIAALEAVLKKLQDSDAAPETATLDIRGDSQLVVNQVLGQWECKEARMQVRCDRVRYLLQQFGNWQLTHHNREQSVQTLGH